MVNLVNRSNVPHRLLPSNDPKPVRTKDCVVVPISNAKTFQVSVGYFYNLRTEGFKWRLFLLFCFLYKITWKAPYMKYETPTHIKYSVFFFVAI